MEYQLCTFAKGLNNRKLLASLAITALVALPVEKWISKR